MIGVITREALVAGSALRRLAVPSVAVFCPLGLATAMGWPVLVERGLERTAVLSVVAWLITWVVVLAATVDIACGMRQGRHVPAGRAMRTAARRLPSLVGVLLAALVAALVIAVAVVAAARYLGWVWAAVVLVVLVAGALPLTLALPVVVVEGGRAGRAVRRGYQVFLALRWPSRLRLAAGAVVVPGGVAWALLASTPKAAHPAVWAGCALLTPLIAVTLAAAHDRT